MGDPARKAYDDLVEKITAFLARQSCPTRIDWVFREDLACVRRVLYVRAPLPTDNRDEVIRSVTSAEARALGFEVLAFAIMNDLTLCTVTVPRNRREAEELMIEGLKMAVRTDMPSAIPASGWRWLLARLRQRNPHALSLIPKRSTGRV